MSSSRNRMTRRDVLRGVVAGAGAAIGAGWPTIVTGRALGADGTPPASERINIGFIGCGNQWGNNLRPLIKHAMAVCEVDAKRLAEAKTRIEKASNRPCAAYGDYRKMLENKDIDAVVVTTPDHWHALMTIHACQAGKDVYCEKPLSLTIAEGQAMVKAARKYNRIVQTGSQQRSDRKFRLACELVRSGRLGKIKAVQANISGVNYKGPPVPDSDPPPELDYDFWLGPAPKRPYNVKRVHYQFRFFWDYSGGQMTNWGAHNLDNGQWGMGTDDSGPISAEGTARYHKDNWYEVPEWFRVTYQYANGVTVTAGMGLPGGTTFEGEKGTIHVTRKDLESNPKEIIEQPITDTDVHLYVSDNHHQNWLDCIKSRKLPICDVAIGHRTASVCHLGNIAIRIGRKIAWDPAKEEIVGDAEATKMLSRPYRAPWRLPAL